jgi:DNA replication and repair protein RecF
MGFYSIRFFNFRNLKDRELELGAREVFLVGENGQGKTNLLEAVHLLCAASSFRESRDFAFFRDPDIDVGLSGRYSDSQDNVCSLAIRIPPGKRKEIKHDGKPVVDRKELFDQILSVCLVQQDMAFINGPPEEKRRFFDQTSILSDPSFLDRFRRYRRVLISRNFALKTRRTDLLDAYDIQLTSLGLEICEMRSQLVERFNAVFTPLIAEISGWGRDVSIQYSPSWKQRGTMDSVMEILSSGRARDLSLGTTGSGPHRDSFRFLIGGGDFVPFASTGQMRLCALVLRVAQARYLTDRRGKPPVLLLDDVLLELDHGKRVSLLSRFPAYEQAFFTFLPDENYLPYRREETLVLRVVDGEFAV